TYHSGSEVVATELLRATAITSTPRWPLFISLPFSSSSSFSTTPSSSPSPPFPSNPVPQRDVRDLLTEQEKEEEGRRVGRGKEKKAGDQAGEEGFTQIHLGGRNSERARVLCLFEKVSMAPDSTDNLKSQGRQEGPYDRKNEGNEFGERGSGSHRGRQGGEGRGEEEEEQKRQQSAVGGQEKNGDEGKDEKGAKRRRSEVKSGSKKEKSSQDDKGVQGKDLNTRENSETTLSDPNITHNVLFLSPSSSTTCCSSPTPPPSSSSSSSSPAESSCSFIEVTSALSKAHKVEEEEEERMKESHTIDKVTTKKKTKKTPSSTRSDSRVRKEEDEGSSCLLETPSPDVSSSSLSASEISSTCRPGDMSKENACSSSTSKETSSSSTTSSSSSSSSAPLFSHENTSHESRKKRDRQIRFRENYKRQIAFISHPSLYQLVRSDTTEAFQWRDALRYFVQVAFSSSSSAPLRLSEGLPETNRGKQGMKKTKTPERGDALLQASERKSKWREGEKKGQRPREGGGEGGVSLQGGYNVYEKMGFPRQQERLVPYEDRTSYSQQGTMRKAENEEEEMKKKKNLKKKEENDRQEEEMKIPYSSSSFNPSQTTPDPSEASYLLFEEVYETLPSQSGYSSVPPSSSYPTMISSPQFHGHGVWGYLTPHDTTHTPPQNLRHNSFSNYRVSPPSSSPPPPPPLHPFLLPRPPRGLPPWSKDSWQDRSARQTGANQMTSWGEGRHPVVYDERDEGMIRFTAADRPCDVRRRNLQTATNSWEDPCRVASSSSFSYPQPSYVLPPPATVCRVNCITAVPPQETRVDRDMREMLEDQRESSMEQGYYGDSKGVGERSHDKGGGGEEEGALGEGRRTRRARRGREQGRGGSGPGGAEGFYDRDERELRPGRERRGEQRPPPRQEEGRPREEREREDRKGGGQRGREGEEERGRGMNM
ncbi:hypothetical protein CSUI_011107, partial [Cystoisospora suis]